MNYLLWFLKYQPIGEINYKKYFEHCLCQGQSDWDIASRDLKVTSELQGRYYLEK